MTTMFNPAHPGSILAETLSYLKISPRSFAKKINVPLDTLEQILRGESPITPETAQHIAAILPSPGEDVWVRMQANFDRWQSKTAR